MNSRACLPCKDGQDSEEGSSACTICAQNYYRPHAHSPASDCTMCSAIQGVGCGSNTTIETLNLTRGSWRHSQATIQTWSCATSGGWTPCQGGVDAAYVGDGYCEVGYHGPRCELCNGPRYFDQLDARCHDCGEVYAKAIALSCALVVAGLVVFCGGAVARRYFGRRCGRCRLRVWSMARYVTLKLQALGLRPKFKVTPRQC